jgi:hypothetical protein
MFDKRRAAAHLRAHALPPFGARACATHVRMALEAGGANTAGHPRDAKDWGPTLARNGFAEVSDLHYAPQLGDIIVIQGTTTSSSGHIEYYDGTNWISDFVQPHPEIWPGPSYRAEKPAIRFFAFCSLVLAAAIAYAILLLPQATDPVFGLKYDPNTVPFEAAPETLSKTCTDLTNQGWTG